jgi:hypothetical protein
MSPTVMNPFCCDDVMRLMAVVPPVGGSYGLRVYVCLKCGRPRDMLIPARAFRASSQGG